MPEHLIRLRGPWELVDPDAAGPEAVRLALPAAPLPASDRPFVLRRRFGRPARLGAAAPCRLRAEDVPGLVGVALNGEALEDLTGDGAGGSSVVEIPIRDRLRPRNVLELTVRPGPDRLGQGGRAWGSIALLFDHEVRPSG